MKRMFVYGQLKRGHDSHHLIEGSKFIGIGTIEAVMYDTLSGCPAIEHGEGVVHGEVFEVDEPTERALDRLEGSRYIKEAVEVTMADQKVEAEAYFWSGRTVLSVPLPGGVW